MQCHVGGIFSWAKLEPRKGYLNFAGWTVLLINYMPPAFIFSGHAERRAPGLDVAEISAGAARGARSRAGTARRAA
jgi:hypothetical protein